MTVVTDLGGPVATITLDRPEAHNAMTTDMYREITEALREIDRNPKILVGVITGRGGRAFSAGADLKEMHLTAAANGHWEPWRAERWDMGMNISKPLIAAIDGYALAGGMELTLLCDLRLATPRSQFGAPEIKWNLLHGYGALRLPRIVGLTNAMMLLLTGEFIDAQEALRVGLINRIVEPEELMGEAMALAETIASRAADAVQMTKELALRGIDGPMEANLRLYHEYMTRLEGSDEQLQRTGDFAAKRDAQTDGSAA